MAVQYLIKLIGIFHEDYLYKLIGNFEIIDIALLISRPTIKLAAKPIASKKKQDQPSNSTKKQAKKN